MPQVRISTKTHARIKALQAIYTESAAAGRSNVVMVDQGAKGQWVTADAIIAKALDELEGHRERSAQYRKQNKPVQIEPGKRDYHSHPDPDNA